MRSKCYRARTWPLVGDAYVLITWAELADPSQRAVIDWFLLSDSEDEFQGLRYRVKLGELYPGGTTDIDFWIGVVEGEVRNYLQGRVDREALQRERPVEPASILLDEVNPVEILALRLRGCGEAGLRAALEEARDPDTRDFIRSVLAFTPIKSERIPQGDGS
jgi:hypothetical protein